MKEKINSHRWNFIRVLGLMSVVCCLWSVFSGCIRLTGSAGYWKQGANDTAPKSKSVGFDTQEWVNPNDAPGSIET